jgi:hypothetical protein
MAIWACQAGKDVYVEKPCSHNLWEAQQLVKAAQKYDRVVQHGTQIRSATAVREAVQKMRDGLLGEIYMGRGLCYKWRDTIGRAPVSDVPAGVDYDLWTGPAPKHPEKQEVIGDQEAGNLLRDGERGYRKPFVVPENV